MDSERIFMRRYGRLAGILFLAGSLATLPSVLLHEPAFSPVVFLLTALGCASGALCLVIPWERLSRKWLHLVGVLATLEVALVAGMADQLFTWFYLLIAVFAAHAFERRREVAAQLGIVCVAVLAPLVYDPATATETLTRAFVVIPCLILAAGLITYVRERLEANQDAYRSLAGRDALTGVANYRSFREYLAQEIGRHARHERQFALVVVDLVGFKQVNERLGHLEGDHVLRQVGQQLAGRIRTQDLVARHGGDEFSVIAPETGARGAALLASRVESAVEELSVDGRSMLASTGWAVFPVDGVTPDELLKTADAALRARKREHHMPWFGPRRRFDPRRSRSSAADSRSLRR